MNLQKILIGYAGVTTAALSWFLVTAAAPATTKFGEIDVQRINIREPDGTLRMTISDAARSPGIIVKGREFPHPTRKAAGMLFFNEEGTENGGLIFGGKQEGGKDASYGSLTFDRYEQDQVVQLIGEQEGDKIRAGIAIGDRPSQRFDFPAIEAARGLPKAQQAAAFAAAGVGGQQRLFVGRGEDKSSQVVLRDGAGRQRIVMRVAENGAAGIDFLDAAGKVMRSVSPDDQRR